MGAIVLSLFPARLQLRRSAGWRMPAGAIKVDRTTRWGNPYKVGPEDRTASEAVSLFRRTIDEDGAYLAKVGQKVLRITKDDIRRELRGRDLACWCPPGAPCHADVLLQIANEEMTQLDSLGSAPLETMNLHM